ncbi:Uncharacterised protein [BD1-7 clade bacterium]|uniref:DUF1223 domain-containing protein n=1 Tax=BD1-7 clade bacterium TaxID=2029982 RepID=A0A5S9P426_9GAMM|nr:Uncharacterised protein [BD1-7 clade bacterium]CAA0097985.1 Uncharacterised protein [BD1-7 clade bacterium]
MEFLSRTLRRLPLSMLMAAALPLSLQLHAETFTSEASQAELVELYTSQGCSSCPPAEAWLSRWKDNPELWKKVVPVAWHVTYWNYLGWPDDFSQSRYDKRQQYYKQLGHSRSVYTPEFIVNGREWRGWFQREALPVSEKTVGVLTATTDSGRFKVDFVPQDTKADDYRLYVAVMGQDIVSDVKRGENAGKKLKHDFVVLDYKMFAPLKRSPINGKYLWQGDLTTMKDAADNKAIAFWVTRGTDPTPIQATGGILDVN